MKKCITFILVCCFLFSGCGQKEEKEWTYELLEEEFGGIIETDFESVSKCLNLIENNEFTVCGYITEKNIVTWYSDSYYIVITDDKENSYEKNTINVSIRENDFNKVDEGEFVYVSGRIQYNNYGMAEIENTVSMMCNRDGKISLEAIEESLAVMEYIKLAREIFEDTYFRTEGLIIQDTYSNGSPKYMLYESEEAYKDSEDSYIAIEFSEEQHNINGKKVVIMGKPGGFISYGLTACSIIEE